MRHRAAQMFPLLLVMVMAVKECGAAGLANSTAPHCPTQGELIESVLNNQMAFLKDIYESSCTAVSCDSELQELRLMKEEVMSEMAAMREMKSELEVMMDEVGDQLAAVQEMLENIQNGTINTPSQEPDTVTSTSATPPSEPPSELPTFHNDTNPSLCGRNKVLHGTRGFLSPSHPSSYSNHMMCEWHVMLPEGTYPEFYWQYVDIEGGSDCPFDSVHIFVPGITENNNEPICGTAAPSHHSMYNIRNSEFMVTFSSDLSVTGRGFMLHYQAVTAFSSTSISPVP